jgi:hypothetical protein
MKQCMFLKASCLNLMKQYIVLKASCLSPIK